jgi:hypothetical protein
LRRHFGLDRAIVLFGKIEVGDAHGIYINVMSSQPVSHVCSIPFRTVARCAMSCSASHLSRLRLDGLLNRWNYHAAHGIVI